MSLDGHFYTVLVSSSCECNTAMAEADKPTDGVEHNEGDDGKQVWNWMTIAGGPWIIMTVFNSPPQIVVTEGPYTTHENPGKEEDVNQALKRTTAMVTTFILIVVIIILFLFMT